MFKERKCSCVCKVCGEWFGLEDGIASKRLKTAHSNTVICESCGEKEQAEIERDEEITELKETIESAEYDIKLATDRLSELGVMV